MNRLSIKGFSLVEILAIITIASVLSLMIAPRLTLFHSDVLKSKSTLTSALSLARQLAIFSSQPNDLIQLSLQNNAISIRKNNIDIKSLGIIYPKLLNQGITHKPDNLLLTFNALGETQTTTISLVSSQSNETVVIYKTGYLE